jgi:hypothetical protein
MSYQDHLVTCFYCNKNAQRKIQIQKPTVRIKAASSYRRERKLSELASIIKGVSYSTILYPSLKTCANSKTKTNVKGASSLERSQKLKELDRLVRGL